MNEIDKFRDSLVTHLLSMHGAIDEQIEDKPLDEVVGLHDKLHPSPGFWRGLHATSGDKLPDDKHHEPNALVIGKPTSIFLVDLPVQIVAHSKADVIRRIEHGLEDGPATIKQDGKEFSLFYLNAEMVYDENVEFNGYVEAG